MTEIDRWQPCSCRVKKLRVEASIAWQVALLYRAPLEPQMSADLRAAAPELELGVLVPSLRSFLVARCVMESISAGSALKESLDWVVSEPETRRHS